MNAYSLSRLFIAYRLAHLPRDTVIRSSAAGSRGGKSAAGSSRRQHAVDSY